MLLITNFVVILIKYLYTDVYQTNDPYGKLIDIFHHLLAQHATSKSNMI